ncbi:unnamed protein product [Oppiella nova]|uniref:Uncharacterized protein n=1 Tax=Oppiella nova TaxID=334625 RepID=A0A7R9QLP7_9ACAR|nr:unnamed protein product [Oppiella nova]CAG2168453.1 unnamed protein product [Oppiella nova]
MNHDMQDPTKSHLIVKVKGRPSSLFDLMERIVEDGVDIFLSPVTSSAYFDYTDKIGQINANYSFKYTNNMGYLEVGTFIARTTIGAAPLLTYFRCFQLNHLSPYLWSHL